MTVRKMEDREADEEGLDARYEGTFLSCRLSQTFSRRAGSQCFVSASARTSHIPKSSAHRKPRAASREVEISINSSYLFGYPLIERSRN